MTIIKIKGYEINAPGVKDSFNRRALRFKNNIITTLRAIGLTEDDIEIELEPNAIKNVMASASWYVEGVHLHYSYKAGAKYADNLFIISKLIALEVLAILEKTKTIDEFIADYTENHDVEEERQKARKLLGVDPDTLDLNIINKRYKDLAKDAHPDTDNGSTEKFKALNHAHKVLKRELE